MNHARLQLTTLAVLTSNCPQCWHEMDIECLFFFSHLINYEFIKKNIHKNKKNIYIHEQKINIPVGQHGSPHVVFIASHLDSTTYRYIQITEPARFPCLTSHKSRSVSASAKAQSSWMRTDTDHCTNIVCPNNA
jgi:hypothetical protein